MSPADMDRQEILPTAVSKKGEGMSTKHSFPVGAWIRVPVHARLTNGDRKLTNICAARCPRCNGHVPMPDLDYGLLCGLCARPLPQKQTAEYDPDSTQRHQPESTIPSTALTAS